MILTWIIGGAAMAGGGWLFHHVVKSKLQQLHNRVDTLESRVGEWEK